MSNPLLKAARPMAKWVGLKAVNLWEDIRFPEVLSKNADLKNSHVGQRIFIFGTGYSINDLDVGRFQNENTMIANFFFRHPQLRTMNPTFFASPPPIRHMRGKTAELEPPNYLTALDRCIQGLRTKVFLHVSCKPIVEALKLLKEQDVYYLKCGRPMAAPGPLSNDMTRRMSFMDGVVYFMVASAMYMGFREIFLLGCGYTFSPVQEGHYYDDVRLIKNVPPDPKLFQLKAFAQERQCTIKTVVPPGFSSAVLETVSYEEIGILLGAYP